MTETIQLRTLNDSGVTGSATLTQLGEDRTRVEVRVDPAGHLDMPAHIHPGTCDVLTPQPKYPLENVRNGTSTDGGAGLNRGSLGAGADGEQSTTRTWAWACSVACAEIRDPSSPTTTPAGSIESPSPVPSVGPGETSGYGSGHDNGYGARP